MFFRKVSVAATTIAMMLWLTGTYASLDLLAGVEAGIETDTAMTSTDLEQTQRVLSTQSIGTRNFWLNEATGTAYEIIITHEYDYGHYPCLGYNLIIKQQDKIETKSLDACKNNNGQWISVTSSSSAL